MAAIRDKALDDGECGFTLHDFVLPHQALVIDAALAGFFRRFGIVVLSFQRRERSHDAIARRGWRRDGMHRRHCEERQRRSNPASRASRPGLLR